MAEQRGTPADNYDLSTIDQVALTPIVRRALNLETIEISDWNYSRVYGGAGDVGAVLSGVYRFTGQAHDRDKPTDWSVILKVVGTTAIRDDPSEHRYWKREVLAYQSGELVNLPGGLTAPRFLAQSNSQKKWLGYGLKI